MTRFGSRSFGGRFDASVRLISDGLEIVRTEHPDETRYLWNGRAIDKRTALAIAYGYAPPTLPFASDDFDERLGQSFDESV